MENGKHPFPVPLLNWFGESNNAFLCWQLSWASNWCVKMACRLENWIIASPVTRILQILGDFTFFDITCTMFAYSFMEITQVNEGILNELHWWFSGWSGALLDLSEVFTQFLLNYFSSFTSTWVFFLRFETIESISIKINYTWNGSASREFGKELARRAILKVVFCHLTTQVVQKKESKWLFLANSWVSTQKVLISCCRREIIWAVYVSWGAGELKIVNA